MFARKPLALCVTLALFAAARAAPTTKQITKAQPFAASSPGTRLRVSVTDLLSSLTERRRGGGGGGGRGGGSSSGRGRGSAAVAAAAAAAARPGKGRGRGKSPFDDDDEDELYAEEEEEEENSCFPAEAVVMTPTGVRNMSELAIGTIVTSTEGPTQVHAFTHRVRSGWFNFVRLSTNAGVLTVSPGHYIHTDKGLRPARLVRVGDALQRHDRFSRVMSVQLVTAKGLYNPHTAAGELLVDGFRVSCYTTAVRPQTAHALLTPVRASFALFGIDVTGNAFAQGAPKALTSFLRYLRLRGDVAATSASV